jgi:hypothetical protein
MDEHHQDDRRSAHRPSHAKSNYYLERCETGERQNDLVSDH